MPFVKLNLNLLILITLFSSGFLIAQPVPSDDEKIPFICTFGKDADKKWGDDDNVQIFFFTIPESRKAPFYIRIFDAETGGKYDEMKGTKPTKTVFSVYGGAGAHSNADAKKQNPSGNFKSGVLLSTKTFINEPVYDNNWTALGPFNPAEGELQAENGGFIFKLVVQGTEGGSGNLYRLFLSSEKERNSKIEGGNAFCYEYTFRLEDKIGFVSHIYPFIPKNVLSVEINVFDYDNEGIIRTVTIAKKGEITQSATEGTWSTLKIPIVKEEYNTSMDIQFIKKNSAKNNNVAVYITNQFGELLPFYATPIGGVPKFKYKIGVKKQE
jgi:hypothetical protein